MGSYRFGVMGRAGGGYINGFAAGVAGAETGPFDLAVTAAGRAIGAAAGDAIENWQKGIVFSQSTESKPKECPSGTLHIDKAKKKFGLDKYDVHDIKDQVGAGPKDWTGIDPDGNVWTGDGAGQVSTTAHSVTSENDRNR